MKDLIVILVAMVAGGVIALMVRECWEDRVNSQCTETTLICRSICSDQMPVTRL